MERLSDKEPLSLREQKKSEPTAKAAGSLVCTEESTHIVGELFSAKHVEVQVWYRLAGVLSAIGNHTVAVFQPLLGGNFRDCFKNVCHGSAVFRRDCVAGRDVYLRNHQNMDRRHRMNVAEGIDGIVFKNFGRGDFPRNNFTEQTIAHTFSSFPLGLHSVYIKSGGLSRRDQEKEKHNAIGRRTAGSVGISEGNG